MHGSSGGSLGRLTDALGAAVGRGTDGAALGDGLFAASDVLREQPALRRALTDPSSPSEAKVALARAVFGAHLDATATDLVADAAGQRWASSGDLAVALEQLGVIAVVRAADAAGEGDRLEDELFAFGRAVTENPSLRDALSDPARSTTDKQALVRSLLEGKAGPGAIRLAQRSTAGVHLTVTRALDEYSRLAAATRDRLVALVRVARPFADGEQQRLEKALEAQYGRPAHLNVVIDKNVIGGIRVEVGDQVIDGTVASRLDDARRHLVG
jgi:F-type H+-transporting ATPase subunit delta